MKKLFIAAAIAMFGASQAHAGFMIEPYLGYETGSTVTTGSPDNDYTGTVFGARLGYTMLGLMFGVDYMTGSGTSKSTTSETDVSPTDLGAFVGYEFPIMFRIYASYFFDSKVAIDSAGDPEYTGSGTRIGIGYTGLPFVSINFEMLNRNYDGSNAAAGGGDPKTSFESYALTLSLPLP